MSNVVFDPARARVDTAYRVEAMQLYKEGKLEINDNDLKWLQSVLGTSTDQNEYNIEDNPTNEDEEPKIEDDSKTIERSGGSDKAHGIIDLTVSAGAAGSATALGLNAASGLSGAEAQMAGLNSGAGLIACITAFVIGTKYELTRPNKDEHEELKTLQEAMETGNLEIANSLINIQETDNSVETLTTESEDIEETLDEELKAMEKELEKKQARIEELNIKAESEEGLTEEEQAELETLTGEVQTLQEEIAAKKEKGAGEVGDKQDEIEAKQADIEDSANVFRTVLDVANYAETFDESSKNSATLEAVAQGVNAALGYGAAAALTFKSPILSLTPLGQVMRAMALAGAVMSTHGTIEQGIWASDMGDEIDVREYVQKNGIEALDSVDTSTQTVDDGIIVTNDIISDLTNDDPEPDDSMEPPVAPTSTEPEPEPNPEPNPEPDDSDDDKKEPPEV